MRTLVIGSTGFLGPQIIQALLNKNVEVVAASRSGLATQPSDAQTVRLDRSRPESVLEAIRAYKVDTVIDVIAYDIETTKPLPDHLEGNIDRYVLLSSGDVYQNYGLFQQKEGGRPQLTPLDENAPLRQSRFPYRLEQPRPRTDPLQWMDSYDKIPIEAAVRKMKTAWSILRLPMVYGPGDKQNRFRWAIAPMAAQKDQLTLGTQWAAWVTTYGYVENVAAAIALGATAPEAANQIFNIGEECPVPHRIWAERWADEMNWSGKIIIKDLPAKGALAELDLSVPFGISSKKFRETIGFTDPCPLDHALRATIASEIALK